MLALALLLSGLDDGAAKLDAIAARCAIPAERLAVEVSLASDMESVLIRGAEPLSDAQLECVGQVLAAPEMMGVAFDDAALGRRYAWLSGRSNLRAMGLLDRLPVFDATRDTLPDFARKLEHLCRLPRGSLMVDEGNIQVTTEVLNMPGGQFDRVICAVSAIDASGFEALGITPNPVPVTITPAS